MKIITSTILASALFATTATAQNTQGQQLPALPTTQGAKPIYAPAQINDAPAVIYSVSQQQQQAVQQQQQWLQQQAQQQFAPVSAPVAVTPSSQPVPAQQAFATATAQPQQQFAPAQAQAQVQQPAPQQFAPAQTQAYAPAQVQPQAQQPAQQQQPAPQPAAQPQQLQQAQPASGNVRYVQVAVPQPVADVPPAGPSVTVARNSTGAVTQQNNIANPLLAPAPAQVQAQQLQQPVVQQQFAPVTQQQFAPAPQQIAPAPQQAFAPQPAVQQPAQQQFAPVVTPAQQPQAVQAQPQQLQQLQPASGQPVAQIQPEPIAIPAKAAPVEPAIVPSGFIANNIAPNAGNSLYDLATVSTSVPLAKASLPKDAYKTLENDSWRQIEFVPANNSTNITNQISEVIRFKQQNWAGTGFRQIMTRPELPVTLAQANVTKERLPKTKATSLALTNGSVTDGFTIADAKSGWFIYGQKDAKGKIITLAVSPDDMPMSEVFAKQLVTLAGADLILVDWYKDTVVDTRTSGTVLDWAGVYKPADLVKK